MSRPVKITDRGQKVLDNLRVEGPTHSGLDGLAARLTIASGGAEVWTRRDVSVGLHEAKGLPGHGTVVVRKHGRAGGATIELIDGAPAGVPGAAYADRVGREHATRLRTQRRSLVQHADTLTRAGMPPVVTTAVNAAATFVEAAEAANQSALKHIAALAAQAQQQANATP